MLIIVFAAVCETKKAASRTFLDFFRESLSSDLNQLLLWVASDFPFRWVSRVGLGLGVDKRLLVLQSLLCKKDKVNFCPSDDKLVSYTRDARLRG